MGLFGGKKESLELGAPGSPNDQVRALKQQGVPDAQIVADMQKQGYSSQQILQALNQEVGAAPPTSIDEAPPPPPSAAAPPQQAAFGQTQQYPAPDPGFLEPQATYAAPEHAAQHVDAEQIEEIAEAIIEEKWKEFERDVRTILDWKEQTEAHMNQLDQKIQGLVTNMDNLQKGVLGKINEYDKNIVNVGTEIKAMEKVFSEVLPSLTENVNKLDRIANKKTK